MGIHLDLVTVSPTYTEEHIFELYSRWTKVKQHWGELYLD